MTDISVGVFQIFLKGIPTETWQKIYGQIAFEQEREVYSDLCQTYNIEHFAAVVNSFAKSSILDVWQDFEYASDKDRVKSVLIRGYFDTLSDQNSSEYKHFLHNK